MKFKNLALISLLMMSHAAEARQTIVKADVNSSAPVAWTNQSNTYSSGPQSLGSQTLSLQLANDTSTGTTLNLLAKVTSSAKAIVSTTSDVTGIIGIVVAGAGTSGNSDLAQVGQASCIFDGATTAGDYVQPSTTSGGKCHDAGSSAPTNGYQILGRVLSTNGSGGTYAMVLSLGGSSGGGATGSEIAYGYWGNASGCDWSCSSTTPTFSNLGTNSNCPVPSPLIGATSASHSFSLTVASLAAGVYEVRVMGTAAGSGGLTMWFRLTDGTQTSGTMAANGNFTSLGGALIGRFSYATSQTNITFQVQGTATSSGACAIYDDGGSGFSAEMWITKVQ